MLDGHVRLFTDPERHPCPTGMIVNSNNTNAVHI